MEYLLVKVNGEERIIRMSSVTYFEPWKDGEKTYVNFCDTGGFSFDCEWKVFKTVMERLE